jgi:hypothetical protein
LIPTSFVGCLNLLDTELDNERLSKFCDVGNRIKSAVPMAGQLRMMQASYIEQWCREFKEFFAPVSTIQSS